MLTIVEGNVGVLAVSSTLSRRVSNLTNKELALKAIYKEKHKAKKEAKLSIA